jgi:hypothetical protein
MIVLQGERVLGNNPLSEHPDFALPAGAARQSKKLRRCDLRHI